MGYSLDTPLTTAHKSGLDANSVGSPSHPTQGNSPFLCYRRVEQMIIATGKS